MKIKCNQCGRELELNTKNFYFTSATKQGYKTPCKECAKANRRRRYWENREKELDYYYKNRDKLKNYQLQYYKENADKIKLQQKAKNAIKKQQEKAAKQSEYLDE